MELNTVKPRVRTKNKVCIVGFAPDSRKEVVSYIHRDDFEIWAINELYMEADMKDIMLATRADRWFQLHHPIPTVRDKDHVQNLAMLKCPVYLCHPNPDIPNHIVYPLKEICEYFDIYGEGMAPDVAEWRDRVYFTNSISYLVALGAYEGFEEIHLVGVNMAQGGPGQTEYSHQKPSVEFFLGWARGAGIKVYLPIVSDICLSPYLYGYDQGLRIFQKWERRAEELQGRINQMENERIAAANHSQQMLNAVNQLRGAKENNDYVYQLGVGNMRGPDDTTQQS